MGLTPGSMTLPRMNAHRLVIIAAAFTIAVAAALATAPVTVSSQALPRAVRHDLSQAADTSFVIRGNVTAAQGARYGLPAVSSSGVAGTGLAVRSARVWNTNWFTSFGQPISVSAVDPAGYAAVVAGTPFPPFPAGRIGAAAPSRVLPPGAVVPVLASPSAAAILGTRPIQLDTLSATAPLMVRVVGTVSETPAQLAGGPFVIMPLLRLPGPAGAPAPNLLLATGTAIDHTRLTAVTDRVIPGSVTAFRTGVLASLASSPLQNGAGLLITLTIATAAALGLFVVILALALGSAERGIILARLTVMGHERAAGLVMAEAMPTLLTAIAAGVACAFTLPLVIGSAIDLSAFTGTSIPVRLQPDALALGLPAVIIGVLALAALAAEARSLRRRDVAGLLRAH